MSYTKVFLKDQVRIYVTDVTEIAQTAIEKHKANPLPALALATAIATFGPLGVMKKYGRTQAVLKGEGALKNIIVESNVDGDIRALVGDPTVITEYDQTRFNDIPLTLGIGQIGILKITNEVNDFTFGGEVKLAKGDIVTDLAWYFDQSEQVSSAVAADVELETPTKLKRAWGVIFQMLPQHHEGDILYVENIIKNVKMKDFATLDAWIKELKAEELSIHKLQWKCSCSKEKMQLALDSLSKHDQQQIIKEHGKLEVTCNFCNTSYDFTNQVEK